MANRSYSDIKGDMNTELQAVVDDGSNPIQDQVYGYHTGSFSGYPAIRWTIASVGSERLTRNDYWRGWIFRIEVVQEIARKDPSTAEDELGAAVDAVVSRLEENWDLSGDMADPPEGEAGQDTDSSGKVRSVSMLATVRSFMNYST